MVQISRDTFKWSAATGQGLVKLMHYFSTAKTWRLRFEFVGSALSKDFELKIYCDADHGGCPHTGRSTP